MIFMVIFDLKTTINSAESLHTFLSPQKRTTIRQKLFKAATKNRFALKQTKIIVVLDRKPIYHTCYVGDDRSTLIQYQNSQFF